MDIKLEEDSLDFRKNKSLKLTAENIEDAYIIGKLVGMLENSDIEFTTSESDSIFMRILLSKK